MTAGPQTRALPGGGGRFFEPDESDPRGGGGREDRLSEAVTNCVVHAYEGKVEKITVECMIRGQELTVLVEDKGCGIADVRQAMEPLFTTKPDSERCGMGLCLYGGFHGFRGGGVKARRGHESGDEKKDRKNSE